MPESLIIEAGYKTPKVVLDKANNTFELSGASFIENDDFYHPIMEWIEEYVKDPNPETVFVVKLNFINTVSSKVLALMVMKLAELNDQGHQVKINWHYESYDEDIKQHGEDLSRASGITFEFIEY